MESIQADTVAGEIAKHLRHNLAVNLLDGGFFGLAFGFSSFVTVLPLFVSTLTSSPILIGLIPALHNMGWQLPQLLTSNRVSRLRRYKPMVLLMTINERLPFLGLALVAWMLPVLDRRAALVIIFALLTWQGMGGGLTATAWQAMICKIIPARQRGTFFGLQSSASNLLGTAGAIAAGFILGAMAYPQGFAVCFILASAAMVLSWLFIAATHEPEHAPDVAPPSQREYWAGIVGILTRDANFRWYLLARMFGSVATVGFAFYIVYLVPLFGASEQLAGLLTGTLLAAQIAANGLMGFIGDRRSHLMVMKLGALAALSSAALALWAPAVGWFFLVFPFSGVANAALWTTGLALTLEFGRETDRPAYIGLANTLVAPSSILAPLLGGWLAAWAGYPAAFVLAIAGAFVTWVVLQFFVQDPRTVAAR